jgi:hypothetical protein
MEERYIEIDIKDLLEVTLKQEDDFLKIKETLTRIGISSRKEKKLWQSCHILHKRGNYYIVHFKELFALDELPTNLSDEDIARRNTIANLLEEWELLEIVDQEKSEELTIPVSKIKILPYKEKDEWELCPKYHIGKNR